MDAKKATMSEIASFHSFEVGFGRVYMGVRERSAFRFHSFEVGFGLGG